MTETTAVNWADANQQYLMARLLLVREALSQYAKRNELAEPRNRDALLAGLHLATSNLPGPAALDHLCAAFNLSTFERDVLLLCAGVELDSSFAELCVDSQRSYPTFGLALAALPEAHWSALSPAAPLRYWRLIELAATDTITRSQLRIDERVLHYLAGVSGLDARLQGLIEPVHSHATLPSSHLELSQQIARLWQNKDAASLPIINLCGEQPAANQAVAAFTCHLCNVPLNLLRAIEIPAAVAEREALSRLWEREAALGSGALLIDCDEIENTRALYSLLENVRGMLIVVSREPVRLWRRRVIRFDVRKPSATEQKLLWQQSLGAIEKNGEKLVGENLNGDLNLLVSQFSLEAQTISTVSALAVANRTPDDASSSESNLLSDLWNSCRTQARSRLDDLAQRIEPFATWDDIVLPESQRRTLRDVAAHVRQRSKVYETWGFAARGDRGLGISAMFAGVSGTGKTMAAEVLANELQLDLYRIDLSQVVSKYIGETEKNLRRVFDAAEEGGAILLFDEADALFGKRTEVRDSHDRYANIEVSYLLQRMESYRGLAILTTNMKSVLDTAFLRRIRFIVHFPFPDMVQRAEIWRRIFPTETPTENLDNSKLARLNVAGGNIRNIALHAAFLAADAGKAVEMRHLLHAARSEYAKLEKPLTDTETANWL
ncbi:MAG TPA: AAA family ATPase [Pyrinomonadaceae bacterium]|nr:AAA family ATPase [Pyrinomonadaceae bacterium]